MKKLSKITESIWSDIQDRSMGNVRKEDGMIIGQLEDGTKLIIPNEAWEEGGNLLILVEVIFILLMNLVISVILL